jgi:hypothetical protein
VINEVPAVGISIGTLLLLISMVAGGPGVRKTAFRFFALGSLFALLAFFTGPIAEIRVRTAPGLSISRVEEHHNAANLAVWFSALLGFMSVGAVAAIKRGRKLSRVFMGLTLFVSLAAAASTGWAAYAGIRVYSSEVRGQYQPQDKPDEQPNLPRVKETPRKRNPVPET